jgi:hypothetical protein
MDTSSTHLGIYPFGSEIVVFRTRFFCPSDNDFRTEGTNLLRKQDLNETLHLTTTNNKYFF